jgi:hypothetical protein
MLFVGGGGGISSPSGKNGRREKVAIFNGRYEWDGTKSGELEPVAWYPGSYDVKIVILRGDDKVVSFKSVLCLFAGTGEGQSISAHPEKFAKRICADFSLALERVLWVEDLLEGEDRYQIVNFSRAARMGKEHFYRPSKRIATVSEKRLITQAIDSIEGPARPGETVPITGG